ncbi:hypothetical protein EVAR_3901_1 [Eumeta japonica]|uniref:Uncharacterized protein n=1 Tax=Eumeta variegata TaxID=151549 RepID=A0A4C1SRJ4_EUMVA|nr:hypothetical protein EVAR_3901_1 [Eumeta japonica]
MSLFLRHFAFIRTLHQHRLSSVHAGTANGFVFATKTDSRRTISTQPFANASESHLNLKRDNLIWIRTKEVMEYGHRTRADSRANINVDCEREASAEVVIVFVTSGVGSPKPASSRRGGLNSCSGARPNVGAGDIVFASSFFHSERKR